MTRTGPVEPEEADAQQAGDGGLEIRQDRDGVTAVVRFAGDLDLSTVAMAEAAVAAAESGAPEALLLDLSALAFVDSSGVRVVLLADARARTAGRALAVAVGHGPARRLFDVLGLLTRLDVVDAAG